jgi:tRNA pseudouridine55 synthase
MSARRPGRRAVNGVLLLDKPRGITSHGAVQKTLRLLNAAKGGHTGTLDPLATGLLPVCLGEATKFSHLLLDADKTYLAVVKLGVRTTTGDLEGEVIERAAAAVSVERSSVEEVLARSTGEILQTPPMYSAIKHAGTPLYQHARAGREIERAARKVFIRRLSLVELGGDEVTVRVSCSKGTYVRVLAEDIGRALGFGGCLAALRREAVGAFELSSAATLDRLESIGAEERDALLLPSDALVASLPRLELDALGTRRLSQGQQIEHLGAPAAGLARIYGPDREFLGIAEVAGPGRIVPKRLTVRG